MIHEAMRWEKKGFVWNPDHIADWWVSHTMAPTAILKDDKTIRIYIGCWQEGPLSRIGYVDVAADNPAQVLGWSEVPLVDIGGPGTFDEAGVFPAHVTKLEDGRVYLYYTGFQHSVAPEVDHFNFCGLAVSDDGGDTFTKVSKAPVLDRADEGLHVRAGVSVVEDKAADGAEVFRCVYSAGSGFSSVGGKLRPYYEVFYQDSADGIQFARQGRKIVALDKTAEHGLGRPQIVKIGDNWYVFYTRRTLDMKYTIGCAWSPDRVTWQRIDDWVAIPHGVAGAFDDEFVYFPCVVEAHGRHYLFYCGNGYGRTGFGYAELVAR